MKKGFTLIEILVVIAIVGIVSAVVLSILQNHSTTPQTEQQFCEGYSNYSARYLPVKCLKYFNINTVDTSK